jgi:hypothetical protein
MSGTILAADECTPVPVGDRAPWDLDRLPADDQGRVIIRLRDPGEVDRAVTATGWYRTSDLRTGYAIEVRAADCGHGCHCAAQVRVI